MYNGIITTNIILDTCKNDFAKLYNPSLENRHVAFANEIEKQGSRISNYVEYPNFTRGGWKSYQSL